MKKDRIVLVHAVVSEDGSLVKITPTLHKNKNKAYNAMKDCMLKILRAEDYMQIIPYVDGRVRGNVIKHGNGGTVIKHIWQICKMQKHWGIIYVDSYDGTIDIYSQTDTKDDIDKELIKILSKYDCYIGRGDYNICDWNWGKNDMANAVFPDVYKILSIG